MFLSSPKRTFNGVAMFCPGEIIKTVLIQNSSVIMRKTKSFCQSVRRRRRSSKRKKKDHTDLVLPCLNEIKTREFFFSKKESVFFFCHPPPHQSKFFREKKGVNRVVVGSCERDREVGGLLFKTKHGQRQCWKKPFNIKLDNTSLLGKKPQSFPKKPQKNLHWAKKSLLDHVCTFFLERGLPEKGEEQFLMFIADIISSSFFLRVSFPGAIGSRKRLK